MSTTEPSLFQTLVIQFILSTFKLPSIIAEMSQCLTNICKHACAQTPVLKQTYCTAQRLQVQFRTHRHKCNGAGLPDLQTVLQQAGSAHPGWSAGAAVNSAVFAAGFPVLSKGLTGWGMVNAFVLGTTIFAAFGAGGFALVCVYFLFGTAVSTATTGSGITMMLVLCCVVAAAAPVSHTASLPHGTDDRCTFTKQRYAL